MDVWCVQCPEVLTTGLVCCRCGQPRSEEVIPEWRHSCGTRFWTSWRNEVSEYRHSDWGWATLFVCGAHIFSEGASEDLHVEPRCLDLSSSGLGSWSGNVEGWELFPSERHQHLLQLHLWPPGSDDSQIWLGWNGIETTPTCNSAFWYWPCAPTVCNLLPDFELRSARPDFGIHTAWHTSARTGCSCSYSCGRAAGVGAQTSECSWCRPELPAGEPKLVRQGWLMCPMS